MTLTIDDLLNQLNSQWGTILQMLMTFVFDFARQMLAAFLL